MMPPGTQDALGLSGLISSPGALTLGGFTLSAALREISPSETA
jgi:hypothetical protein